MKLVKLLIISRRTKGLEEELDSDAPSFGIICGEWKFRGRKGGVQYCDVVTVMYSRV